MSQKMLHEISKRSIKINQHREYTLSWYNFVLTVNTDKNIHFFDLSYNVHCLDKNIDCLETSMSIPLGTPAKSLFSNKLIKDGLQNIDLIQTIIDPQLWTCNKQLAEDLTSIVSYKWSPIDFINNNQCVLATLNSISNVELFLPQRYNWKSVLNLSSIIEKHFKSTIHKFRTDTFPENLEQLKEVVNIVQTSAICWSPKSDQTDDIYFVTAQNNGTILIWSLNSHGAEVKAELVGSFETEHTKILSMLWIPITETQFLVICSKINGQIFVCDFQMAKNKIELLKIVLLWKHKDKMIAKYLQYIVIGDKIIILYNKNKHLLLQMLDKNCEVKAQYMNNVNDNKIIALIESNNEYYLGTVNCKIYKIEFVVSVDTIDVSIIPLQLKDTYTSYELYGISFSRNNLLCTLALVDRQIMHRKEPMKIEVTFFCYEMEHQNEILMLINNPTRKLTHLWDCIELLRYKTMKLKVLPAIDFNQLYKDGNSDVYKLKIYLILVILYHNLEKNIQNGSKGQLPEISIQVVKEKILVLHATMLITNLCEKYKQNGNILNDFEIESYIGAKNFLKSYSQNSKVELDSLVPSDVLNVLQKDIEYTCQCCEEKLEGFSCKNKHLNMFCPITFTPIEDIDYLVCKSCNITARIELYEKKPTCIYCDLYLNSS